jgi:hypothetical protein
MPNPRTQKKQEPTLQGTMEVLHAERQVDESPTMPQNQHRQKVGHSQNQGEQSANAEAHGMEDPGGDMCKYGCQRSPHC